MKIELISIHIKNSPQAMPLPAAMLKAHLDSTDELKGTVETSLSDFYLDQSVETIANSILSEQPDMIGFSTYLWNRDRVIKIAGELKKRAPEISLFAGGAEASAMPEALLKAAPFDFVIKGEGETALTETIRRLVKNEPITETIIQGLPVKELETLPSPFLTGTIPLEKYDGVLWELSRGCPFKCDFCFESRGVAGIRRFSFERIKKELELFEERKVTQVFVLDPTFNQYRERAKKILRMIIDIAPAIHFTFEVRTEFLDREMAKLFGSINCGLQIGLQSSNSAVLANVNRLFNPAKFKEKIALLTQENATFGLDLICGLPGDNLDGFKKSLDFAVTLQPNNLDIFPLSVLPGTVLFEKAQSFGLNYMPDAPYTVLSSPAFSENDMAQAAKLTNACNIFYNQGRAVGWLFMILETLDISPSEFFGQFAGWLAAKNSGKDIPKHNICGIQCEFTKDLFAKHNRKNIYAVMADIIRLNDCLNRSLETGPSDLSGFDGKFSDRTVFRLSPATNFLTLQYDLEDVLTVGEVTLVDFIKHFHPCQTGIITYNCGGEVTPLALDSQWINLLNAFDGKSTLEQAFKTIQIKNFDEVNEFLLFCIESGIVLI